MYFEIISEITDIEIIAVGDAIRDLDTWKSVMVLAGGAS